MTINGQIIHNQASVVEDFYTEAYPAIFDIMGLDTPYKTQEIADKMACFQHLAPRTRCDYTKCILAEMRRVHEEQRTFHLIQRRGKWIAPSPKI